MGGKGKGKKVEVEVEKRDGGWNPLLFTSSLTYNPQACNPVTVTFMGGQKPYNLSTFYYSPGNESQVAYRAVQNGILNDWYTWPIAAPIDTDLFFQLKDSTGQTVFSPTPVHIVSNELGRAKDVWCFSDSDDDTVNEANISGPKYNAKTGGDSDDAGPTATATTTTITEQPTQVEDQAEVTYYANEENRMKLAESLLAAFFAVSLVACAVLFFLYFRLRRQYKRARTELATLPSHQYGGVSDSREAKAIGKGGEMSEKKGGLSGMGIGIKGRRGALGRMRQQKRDPVDLLDGSVTPRYDGQSTPHTPAVEVITPTAQNPGFTNPFDEAVAAIRNGDDRFLLSAGYKAGGRKEGFRNSTTSLVSDAPSSQHGSTRTGASGISTEFYHRTKASTIPPKPNTTKPALPLLSAFSSTSSSSSSSSPESSGTAVSSRQHSSTLRGDGESGVSTREGEFGPKSPSIQTVETVIVPISRVSSQSTGTDAFSSRAGDFSDGYDGDDGSVRDGRAPSTRRLSSSTRNEDDFDYEEFENEMERDYDSFYNAAADHTDGQSSRESSLYARDRREGGAAVASRWTRGLLRRP